MSSKPEKSMGVSPVTGTIYYGHLNNVAWILNSLKESIENKLYGKDRW